MCKGRSHGVCFLHFADDRMLIDETRIGENAKLESWILSSLRDSG